MGKTQTNCIDIFIKESMFVIHVKVTHEPWEENYHRASFQEDFIVLEERFLKNLRKRGEKVDIK